ncbi:hypothetical protein FPOAC2_07214 [Fusarium poae]
MSLGFGLGDAALIIKTLWTTVSLLRGEAVDEFRRFQGRYRDLEMVSDLLIDRNFQELGERYPFPRESRQIERLLGEFHRIMENLGPSLGRRRKGKIKGFFQKLRWRSHAKNLERLHQDIFFQFNIIDRKMKPLIEDLFIRNRFLLEDPFGYHHKLDLFAVASWEALHEFLIRIFPRVHKGHEIIQSHRYLLHSNGLADVLCNSPGKKPIGDVIKPGQIMIMSAIFPKLESHDEKCPKCCYKRVANFHGPALQCSRCGLWLRFLDSYDGEPDPLTQIAINDIKASGKAAFAYGFLQFNNQDREHSVDIRTLLRDRMAQIGPIPPERSRAERPKIRHFRRVTLCSSRWPKFSDNKSRKTASELLITTKYGFERMESFLKSEDLPFAWAAAAVGTRFWNARTEQALLRFITSSLQALKHSVPPHATPQDNARLLDDFVYNTEAGVFDFLPERLEARCFLWMLWDVFLLQAKILSSCAKLLDNWSCPENVTRKTPLTMKLFTLPHIALLVPWRLTFDVVEDIIDYCRKRQPIFLPTAIQHFVKKSRSVSLHYYIYGELSTYVQRHLEGDEKEKLEDRLCLD